MADNVIQHSFSAGELAPSLFARTDLSKYRSGAARMRNFFVDFRSGASTRPGFEYVGQAAYPWNYPVRLISFQFSAEIAYVMEFGHYYVRFYYNGDQIVNPDGSPYTINSPYSAWDLSILKFAQLTNRMTFTHPSYPPYRLTANAVTNWVFQIISFGTTLDNPIISQLYSTAGGTANFAYYVSAVDNNGQESAFDPGYVAYLNNSVNMQTTSGSNYIFWNAIPGAVAYNVYKAQMTIGWQVTSGAAMGFVSSVTGTSFQDTNYIPDFMQSPPVS